MMSQSPPSRLPSWMPGDPNQIGSSTSAKTSQDSTSWVDSSEKSVPPQPSIDDRKVELRLAALQVQSIHGIRKLQRIIKPYQRPDSPWVALKYVPAENYKSLLRTLTEATMIVSSDVNRLNDLIGRISQPLGSDTEPLVGRLIAAGDNLLSEHAQETDHFVIAIREYQAAIRELLKCP